MEASRISSDAKTPATDSVKLDSVALARILEEVRNDAVSAPTAYNRMHNRHNR